jgi:hypothetical protein
MAARKLLTASIAAAFFAVASAAHANTIVDLTTAGSFSTPTAATGGTFIVLQGSIDPSAGIGVDAFLRLQENREERGFNSGLFSPLDEEVGPWTEPLLLSKVPVVTIGGTTYRQFLLDINQTKASDLNPTASLLSLNQIQIFQSNASPTSYSISEAFGTAAFLFGLNPAATEVFRMSGTTPLEIQLNDALNADPTTQLGDMFLYVRDAVFDPTLSNVILFSQFGDPNGTYVSNDGFEEWSVLSGLTAPVPEPPVIVLIALSLALVALHQKRRDWRAARRVSHTLR